MIVPGESANIVARFNPGASTRLPLLVTTPLSGWFTCAGERGTGIAIAISVAKEISKILPVLLVMSTGHELGFYGATRFVESFEEEVSGVLHLGSCLAERNAQMRSISNLSGKRFDQLTKALDFEGVEPEQPGNPMEPAEWIGESELWAPRGVPMISIAGTSRNFHTRKDIPENATAPELLGKMQACVTEAAGALISQNHNGFQR